MSQTFDYYFNQLGRIGSDPIDNSQRTIANTRFSNYLVSNYYDEGTSGKHVDFATMHQSMMVSGMVLGKGVPGSAVDAESNLLYKGVSDIPLEKLQLNPRQFLTVPYLGKGFCDPTIESQLQQGEMIRDRKSVMNNTPLMDGYSLYSTNKQQETFNDMQIQDANRCGISSRILAFGLNVESDHKPFSTKY